MPNVIKRDGTVVEFNKIKIVNAICKAIEACDYKGDLKLAQDIAEQIEKSVKNSITVEEIQDKIESKLIASSRKDIAKEFISYREQRTKMRRRKQAEIFNEIINAESNDVTRENANMNADTPAGMMMKFASEASREYTDNYLLSMEAKEAVRNNYIHIHDKDYYPTKAINCLQHPLNKILAKGFRAGHGSSRPAKRIETAAMLTAISLETIQNEMFGGQSIPAIDFYLAPYVRKTFIEELDKISNLVGKDLSKFEDVELTDYEYKESSTPLQVAINNTVKRTHQAMEAFIHNMNTIHSRGGNQVVFSSINYGTDTSAEGRLVMRELLNCTYEGVGNGETAVFPIHVFKVKKGINAEPTDPNYDLLQLACKVTAKRFFPNFINLDAPFNIDKDWKPGRFDKEVATMGCRTRVFEDKWGENTSIGRGNLSSTTINLVRLALEAETIDDFMDSLESKISIVVRQLVDRFIFQMSATKKQFPLLMSGMWKGSDELNNDDKVGEVLRHGTLAVGYIGLAECLIALTGKHHGESEEAQELGLKIITFMRDCVKAYADIYKLNISLFATPAEGLSGKFVKKDREDFGVIENITDKEYYTNSNHVPVWYKCSMEHKCKIEAPYHALTLGGHIFYAEFDGDAAKNPDAVMDFVNMIRKYDVGYASVNHTRSRCLDCGFENADANLKVCPKCKSENVDIIQRITGYLVGSINRWNKAKKAELRDRVTHDI